MTDLGEEGFALPELAASGDDAVQFHQELHATHLMGLWDVGPEQVPRVPHPKARPYRWRWQELSRLAALSWRFVPVEQGPSRRVHGRVLALVNPASTNFGTTDTLFAGIQSLLPGETLLAHRHSMQAIRFVLAGHGASTTVDGEQLAMESGDFLLTPAGMWHQHHNPSSSGLPMIWLDGLDLPLVDKLAATFFEPFPGNELPVGDTAASVGFAEVGIGPTNWQAGQAGTSLLRYPWTETRRALEAEARATTTGIVEMEFTNPLTGGAVLPTMSCGIMLLEAGVARAQCREVDSTILLVFRGQGYSVINGERFSWEQGDVVAVPSWAWAEHVAERSPNEKPAILFTMTERPALQALGLYRREEATEGQ